MGSLTVKLAFAGLRSRRAESALSVLVVAAATSALTVGLAIHTVADRPFERTFAAINGGTVSVCDEHPCNAAATGSLVNSLETTTGTALRCTSPRVRSPKRPPTAPL